MHAIGSRIAFFTRNEKGHDTPTDLPGDVVDMVVAMLEQ